MESKTRKEEKMLIFLSFLAVIAAWLSFCLKIIREDERAIKILLGKPGATKTSGLCFVWWPLQWLVRYPTKQQELEIPPRPAITSEGEYPQNSGKNYSAAKINIDAVIYFFWPDNLRNAVIKGPNPEATERIKDFFEEAIADALRISAGGITWRECVQERRGLAGKIKEVLSQDGSPLKEAGIEKFHVVIKEIDLPTKLDEAITKPEIARLEKEAKIKDGEATKEYLRLTGEGEAASRDAIFAAIERGGIAKEALLTLREMAKGTSNTILFGLPPQLYETLSEALDGRRPEELLKLLSPEKRKEVIDFIEKLTKEGGKK